VKRKRQGAKGQGHASACSQLKAMLIIRFSLKSAVTVGQRVKCLMS
jgi:hypothetical protein